MTKLNEVLVVKQNITQTQRNELESLYTQLSKLLKEANSENNITKEIGKDYTDRMRTLEFSLQRNWNFPKDPLYHTWWNKFNDCTCPSYDNLERFGFEKIINCSCPFHSHLCK